ncbi:hypothetical protein [Burkholderia sp. BCC1977]|uniref:hypothetical protein n=1 Tax=Burkholderia sp. BCC1977 TaxID=2817440 RepID=UPI002ABD8BEC|nr:hypothetical protein [Burkholderia sp. BCC1977]
MVEKQKAAAQASAAKENCKRQYSNSECRAEGSASRCSTAAGRRAAAACPLYVHIELADDPAFVLLRISGSSNPDRKPPMRIPRAQLASVLLMLLDAANVAHSDGAIA